MVTRIADRRLYDNIKFGWAQDPEDPERMMLVATDMDNEEMHLFPMQLSKATQLCQLGIQTAAGQKIDVVGANEMPRGPMAS